MRKDHWESHQPACDTVVTVYESSLSEPGVSPAEGDERCLRVAVYYAKVGAYAEVSIKGFVDLRQVLMFETVLCWLHFLFATHTLFIGFSADILL